MSFTRTIKKDWFKALSDDFHCLIGYCIAEWAEVERQLFRICWNALRCPAAQAAVVYARTPTLDARANLTTELLKAAFPRPARKGAHPHRVLKLWQQITPKHELIPIRNRLAHHPTGNKVTVTPGPEDSGGFSELYMFESFGIHLSDFDALRGRHKGKAELVEQDLVDHLLAVGNLREELTQFADALEKQLGEPLGTSPRTDPATDTNQGR